LERYAEEKERYELCLINASDLLVLVFRQQVQDLFL